MTTDTEVTDSVLTMLTQMDNNDITLTLNYMIGVIAHRCHMSQTNLTYMPVKMDGIREIDGLVRSARDFTASVQRQIENLRNREMGGQNYPL